MASNNVNKQYRVVKQGGPFEVHQGFKPIPDANEVVIRTKAVAINPVDSKRAMWGVAVPSWPAVLGADAAGIVESVGSEVKGFNIGDEVLSLHYSDGTFQEYTKTGADFVAKKPASWSFEHASTLPLCFFTAAAALYATLGVPLPFLKDSKAEGLKPKSLLILGGSSNVGASVVQLARLVLPDTLIFATASSKNADYVLSLGASMVFDHSAADVTSQIRAASPSEAGIDAIIDAVGAAKTQPGYLELPTGPKIFAPIMTGVDLTAKDAPAGVDFRISTSADLLKVPGGANTMRSLSDLLAQGKWKVPSKPTVLGKGLEKIGEGIQLLANGVSGTKLVVTV